MAPRAAVQALLEEEIALGGVLAVLGFTSVSASNSLDTPADEKFVVTRWEDQAVQFSRHGPQRLTVWFHTREQDYADIDKAMERVKDVLEDAIHVPGVDGWTLTTADWRGDSQDLIDDGFGTLTRNSGFDVVSRYG